MGPVFLAISMSTFIFLFPTHFHKIIKEKHKGNVQIIIQCFPDKGSYTAKAELLAGRLYSHSKYSILA